MELKHINNCADYFGYGLIRSSIVAESFSLDKNENIDVSLVSKYIELNSKKTYVYLITSRTFQYPLTTKDKYWGFWDRIKKEYKLQIFKSNEKRIEKDRFCVCVGIAEIPKYQIELALNLLHVDFMHSFIILSNDLLNIEQYLEHIIELCDKSKDYSVDFGYIINLECYDNEVVTFIEGNDGCTVNYFYLEL